MLVRRELAREDDPARCRTDDDPRHFLLDDPATDFTTGNVAPTLDQFDYLSIVLVSVVGMVSSGAASDFGG